MPRKKTSSLWSYVGATAAVATTAVAGTIATDNDSAWYQSLDKPKWQPPKWVFPLAWTALYADIALVSGKALADAEEHGDGEQMRSYSRALLLNLVLNFGWSFVFFKAKKLGPAVLVAGALAASSSSLAKKAGKHDPRLRKALSPYAAWTSFATALTTEIWKRNRGKD